MLSFEVNKDVYNTGDNYTVFLVRRGWFSCGPVGAYGSAADPLAIHTADGVLRILAHHVQPAAEATCKLPSIILVETLTQKIDNITPSYEHCGRNWGPLHPSHIAPLSARR